MSRTWLSKEAQGSAPGLPRALAHARASTSNVHVPMHVLGFKIRMSMVVVREGGEEWVIAYVGERADAQFGARLSLGKMATGAWSPTRRSSKSCKPARSAK